MIVVSQVIPTGEASVLPIQLKLANDYLNFSISS